MLCRNRWLACVAAAAFAIGAAPSLAQVTPAVVVAPAEISEVRESAGFTGRVTATQKVDIRARVSGFLEDMLFREGTEVEAGAVLYRIQDDDYRAAVEEIEGSIRAAEAERRLAEIDRDRKAQLVRRQTVAQSELDVAEAQLGKAEGELVRLNGTHGPRRSSTSPTPRSRRRSTA